MKKIIFSFLFLIGMVACDSDLRQANPREVFTVVRTQSTLDDPNIASYEIQVSYSTNDEIIEYFWLEDSVGKYIVGDTLEFSKKPATPKVVDWTGDATMPSIYDSGRIKIYPPKVTSTTEVYVRKNNKWVKQENK